MLVLSFCHVLFSIFKSTFRNRGEDVISSSASESESKTVLNLGIKIQNFNSVGIHALILQFSRWRLANISLDKINPFVLFVVFSLGFFLRGPRVCIEN